MKKLLCILLTMVFILSTVAFADVSGEVSYSETEKTVYIAGDLSKAEVAEGKYVTLLIKDKEDDSIKYITQKRVGKDKKYEIKFTFTGDLSDCDILLREGNNPVEDSVTASYTQQSTMYSFMIRDENGSRFIEPDEMAKIIAEIDNKHGQGGEYKILAAFYDANKNLLSCRTVAEGEYSFYDTKIDFDEVSALAIPEGTDMIKAFLWQDTKEIIPLAKSQIAEISDMKFGGDTEEVRVAFIGDSITYQTYYTRYLEHYYHTRYPDKDIVFINKGIGGNMSLELKNRVGWDIVDDKVAGDIDEAIIYFGMNNIAVAPMNSDSSVRDVYMTDAEAQKAKLDTYLKEMEEVIKGYLAADISLTVVTSSLWDDYADLENGTDLNGRAGLNEILGKGLKEFEKLARKYDIPVIDMWTPTTNVTNELRAAGEKGPIVTSKDRVHPHEQGGLFIAYEFAKQQDGNPVVASVEVDATSGTVANSENADVRLISASSDKVSYDYLAGAIPFAYSQYYETWENWNVPISEDINRELIKVTGLEDGEYTITIGDSTLSKTYTAAELANGVNIATDANNPAQLQAQQSFEYSLEKVLNEKTYRIIAKTQQAYLKLKAKNPSLDIADYGPETTKDELTAIGFGSDAVNYFSDDPDNYGSKMYEVENWNKLRQQEDAARDAAKPIKRTVVIEKAN